MKRPIVPTWFPAVTRSCLLSLFLAPWLTSVQANVYPTSLRLNGSFSNAVAGRGTNVVINYLLNEPATAGVTVEIVQNAIVVRSISVPGGGPGALKGPNSVTWDTRDNAGLAVATGLYSARVTASTQGYTNWSQITDDANAANHIWEGRGITVNRNTNSIYYGRVFVGNADNGPNADINPLEQVGIHKMNADGTFAGEGGFSDGGYDWAHGAISDHSSPWKLEVGPDDRLYANDFYLRPGVVLSFDQTVNSASRRIVLETNNYENFASQFSGMTVSGSATNVQLWMADASTNGQGIRRWDLNGSGMAATSDLGVTVIQSGSGSDLDIFPEDVTVDGSNRVYVIQRRETSADPAMRLLCFPPYGGTPETLAEWKIGAQDDTMCGAYGVAVDPKGIYAAVALRGLETPDLINGAVRIFGITSNGAPVVTLTPETTPSHDHWDAAWDNAGNLYAIDGYEGIWRAYSPPGANQATTVAIPQIQVVGPPMPPVLGIPSYDGAQVQFTLFGEANVSYIIQSSSELQTWVNVLTNTSASASRPISLSSSSSQQFFRAKIAP